MQKACSGSVDRSLPKGVNWKVVPHRLFFGHTSTATWGPGGVAFLQPGSDPGDTAYLCIYKITYVVEVLQITFLFVGDHLF